MIKTILFLVILTFCFAQQTEKKDIPCTVCQTVVTALHALARQNVSQEVLFKQAERLCPFINPPEYRPKVCPRMIKIMGPIVIEVALSRREIQAKYFCGLLGICPPGVSKLTK